VRGHNHPPNTGSLAQAFRQVSSLRAQLTHAAADLAALHELVAISGGGGGGEIEAAAAAAAAMQVQVQEGVCVCIMHALLQKS
jgi:hypothetical protein